MTTSRFILGIGVMSVMSNRSLRVPIDEGKRYAKTTTLYGDGLK
ncbi:hypothetical protein [Desulfocapsa sulfexigens]|nr:hypothetical protein [Desulfocapsa sulfexigens]